MTHSAPLDAFEFLPALRDARQRAGRILVGLDFDGTLAAIVPHPADAALVNGAAAVLRDLDAREDTLLAVVTGRSIADIRARMDMSDIHYAGNHGIEIEGPDGRWEFPGVASARPAIAALLETLADEFEGRTEITFEDKVLSASVHYREVHSVEEQARIAAAVHAAAAPYEDIRLTGGKKVVEIRPIADWDKGRAMISLRESLGCNDAPAIFIGDDMTDEDAFRALTGGSDVSIVVGADRARDTSARAILPDIDAVVRFLAELAV